MNTPDRPLPVSRKTLKIFRKYNPVLAAMGVAEEMVRRGHWKIID